MSYWQKTAEGIITPDPGFKLVGLSMSKCVNDIILGNVKEEDVLVIITATRMPDSRRAVPCYWDETWKEYAEKVGKTKGEVAALIDRLWKRIVQPRLDEELDHIPDSEHSGHWLAIPAMYYPC